MFPEATIESAMKRVLLITGLTLLMLAVDVPAFAQVTKVIADADGIT